MNTLKRMKIESIGQNPWQISCSEYSQGAQTRTGRAGSGSGQAQGAVLGKEVEASVHWGLPSITY